MSEEQDTTKKSATGAMRLARFLAAAGKGSRRVCEEYITEGRVTVNGQPQLTPACVVTPGVDVVQFDGCDVSLHTAEYIALNKPVGYTCSAEDAHAERLVYELLPADAGRLFTIGRLDRDTEGLIILTNDGELAQFLTHPSHEVEKIYVADCDGMFTDAKARMMLDGVNDGGEFLHAKRIRVLKQKPGMVMLEITLTEGKKREVRRLCAHSGLSIVRLARIAFGGLSLGSLRPGQWRRLTADEVAQLRIGRSAEPVRRYDDEPPRPRQSYRPYRPYREQGRDFHDDRR